MFGIITKVDCWTWREAGLIPSERTDIKGVQDAFVLSRIGQKKGCQILEVGGGRSRILRQLGPANECWNAEKLDRGQGRVVDKIDAIPNVRTVEKYMGDFAADIPDEYFDYVVSISVVEHVPAVKLQAFFGDCIRVLKQGGEMLHAIDVYLFDPGDERPASHRSQERVRIYRDALAKLPAYFIEPPDCEEFRTSARWATNTDYVLYAWNKLYPELKDTRAAAQSVSLKVGMVKGERSNS